MRKHRDNRGFTMVETLMAVAIVIILGGLIFVNVMAYQRSLRQLEYDATAKKLFVAAQNHLTMANSQGLLDQLDPADLGVSEDSNDIYYFVYSPSSNPFQTRTAASLMLPFASIDETVRAGSGSYVVRYQKSSALVLEVFYSGECAFSGAEGYYTYLRGFSGDDKKTARRDDFTSPAGKNAIIGWYGAEEGVSVDGDELQAPSVKIVNAEQLRVVVTNPNVRDNASTAQIRLVITGKKSGGQRYFDLVDADYRPNQRYAVGKISSEEFSVVLDSITDGNHGHFATRFKVEPDSGETEGEPNNIPFIPGEDIRVEAIAFSNSRLVNIARSGSKTTNSLFASTLKHDASKDIARIANIRHIENLYDQISSLGENDDDNKLNVTAAEQIASLAWTDDSWKSSTASDANEFYESLKGFRERVLIAKRIHELGSSVPVSDLTDLLNDGSRSISIDMLGTPYTSDSYVPIQADYLNSYDGKNHAISNVIITATGDAGLFKKMGTTEGTTEAMDVELRNFNVTTTSGNAGALAGETVGATIHGALAYSTKNDAALGITGTGSVGGLVGSMTGGSIERSAAAVYVKSSSGFAGGLVGGAYGYASVKESYSGGHTTNGEYLNNSESEAGSSKLNVQAETEAAGGLVGIWQSPGAVEDCYSTCSAYGGTAGGLVGSMAAGTVSNCYATGLVEGKSEGAFIGTMLSTASLGSGNTYYSLVNMYDATGAMREVFAIGGQTTSDVTALDANTATFNDNAPGTSAAHPYDAYLKERSNSETSGGGSTTMYPLQNIKQLSESSDTGLPKLATTHYGDWPMPEVLFINNPSSST